MTRLFLMVVITLCLVAVAPWATLLWAGVLYAWVGRRRTRARPVAAQVMERASVDRMERFRIISGATE